MLRDITIGQYYPGDSLIHRLDPRVKILGTMTFIAALFVFHSFWGFLGSFLVLALLIGISKVPVKFILRGLKPIFLIIVITFLLNMFMIDGDTLFQLGFLRVTHQGLYTAFFMATRLILLIIGSSLLTLATRPMALTDGIESLLSPLKRIGVPSHELAMMMTIALRFIPTLLEETDKIMKAQQARGADFETGNLFKRARHMIPILIPLFVSAFRIAQDMAMAMEARCYRGGDGRTRMNPMKYKARDGVAFLAMLLFLGAAIAERMFL